MIYEVYFVKNGYLMWREIKFGAENSFSRQ